METALGSSLLGAVVGGVLTAAGAFVVMLWQQYSARQEKKRLAESIFHETISHLQDLVKLLDEEFKSKNLVWFEYTNQIEIVFNSFSRNIEGIALLDGSDNRKSVRDIIMNIYYLSQRSVSGKISFMNIKDLLMII